MVAAMAYKAAVPRPGADVSSFLSSPSLDLTLKVVLFRMQTRQFVFCVLLGIFALAQAQDNCYINDSGFTCCNKELESAMKGAMSGRDLLGSADEIQRSAERSLGGKFETVVALDDFAYKSHFKEGKTCKIEKNGQYALAWQP